MGYRMINVFLCAWMVSYLSGITVIVVEGEEPVTGVQVVACLSLHTWLKKNNTVRM